MTYPVNEETTARLTGIFKDDEGNLLGSGSLDVLTATLYDKKSGEIVNACDHRDVLNANGGTVDESGNFELILDPDDNVLADDTIVGSEVHVLLLEWEYEDTKKGKQEIIIAVKNLSKVPGG